MGGGKGAARRNRKRKAQIKKAAKKETKKWDKFVASLPKISEEGLLNFQIKHFGDDTRPERWFVSPEEAYNFNPFGEVEEEDDGLGYYPDGVKRTLTDEQIAIFRRTELWQLKREQQRQKEDEREKRKMVDRDDDSAASPASESSLEDELLAFANVQRREETPPPQQPSDNQPVTANPDESKKRKHSGEVDHPDIAVPDVSKKRKRPEEVPYDQRHKRKWEKYVEEVDENEGSLTHRRLVRELDNQQTESVDMDY